MSKYTGLIYCLECEIHKENGKVIKHKFKARKERNKIIYRCNYRLKNGTNKCNNDNSVEESYIDDMIKQQLFVINMNIENVDILSLVEKIEVSKTRIEVFYKNLPIKSSFYDAREGKLHYDSLNY